MCTVLVSRRLVRTGSEAQCASYQYQCSYGNDDGVHWTPPCVYGMLLRSTLSDTIQGNRALDSI